MTPQLITMTGLTGLRTFYTGVRSIPVSKQLLHSSRRTMANSDVTAGLDETQIKLLEEECILIDEQDKRVGSASKKSCHLLENINKGMLHRAFSVFLFNTKGELLLQQRSDAKITYPAHLTNTCCSHPLHRAAELEEGDNIGVRRAAQRKLQHELGIRPEEVPLDAFEFLTRIHYKSENSPKDGRWGEHEIDYCLVIQKDVNVNANLNEVKHYEYVNQDTLRHKMATEDAAAPFTPWFKLIAQRFLYTWWAQLDNLEPLKDHATIHRML